MFHENSNNNIDEHKLCHEDKDDKVDWGDNDVVVGCNDVTVVTAVTHTVLLPITVVAQGVLYNDVMLELQYVRYNRNEIIIRNIMHIN